MAGDRVQSFLLIGKSPHRHQAVRRAQLLTTRPTDRAADCFSAAASSTNTGRTGPTLWQRWGESGIGEFPGGISVGWLQGDENGIPPGKCLSRRESWQHSPDCPALTDEASSLTSPAQSTLELPKQPPLQTPLHPSHSRQVRPCRTLCRARRQGHSPHGRVTWRGTAC